MSSMDADEEYGPKVPASLDQHNANQEGNGQGADQGSDASAPGDNSSNSSGSPDSTANPNDKSSAATSTASDSQAGAKQKDQVYTVLPLDRVNDVRSSMRMGTQIPIAEGSPFKVLVAAYIEAQKNGW